jgi:hypothetical protein
MRKLKLGRGDSARERREAVTMTRENPKRDKCKGGSSEKSHDPYFLGRGLETRFGVLLLF